MFRYLLSSRLIQGGLVFFLLVVGGSLLYSWHAHRTTENEMARRDEFLKPLEKQKETGTAKTGNDPTKNGAPGFVNTSEETTDTLMPEATEALPNDIEKLDLADAFGPDDFVSVEEGPAAGVPVSPHGFGPYPDVPEDLP